MNQELRAIAERMRKHLEAIKTSDTFNDSDYYHQPLGVAWEWDEEKIGEDDAALARAFLAEHPADEDEPVTDEWLKVVGGEWNEHQFAFGFMFDGTNCMWVRVNGQMWLTEDSTCGGRVCPCISNSFGLGLCIGKSPQKVPVVVLGPGSRWGLLRDVKV